MINSKLTWIVIFLFILLTALWYARYTGKQAMVNKLKQDQITILKQGKEIDDEVLMADETFLCDMLGGCDDGMQPGIASD